MPLLTGVSGFKAITVQDLLAMRRSGLPGIATMIPDKPEIIFQPLFDRVQYPAAGVASLNFFSNVKGSTQTLNVGGTSTSTHIKSLRDTNMEQAGVMSSKGFIAYGISMAYLPLSTGVTATAMVNYMDDVQKIIFGSYIEMKFIDKAYLQIPLTCIPSHMSFKGALATTSNNVNMIGAGGLGNGIPQQPFSFDPPYLIAPNETFSVTLTSDATALSTSNPIDIQMMLWGYMLRPAQ